MLRVRLLAAISLLAALAVVPAAGAAATGTITSQTGWSTVATLAPGVTVSRNVITVSGYSGKRTLTRVSWALGNSHVGLDATPVALSRYGPAQHSFGEGRISSLGASSSALAGINGDTFCSGCARNGGDLLHGLLVHGRRIYATGSGPEVGYTPGGTMTMGDARAVPVHLSLPGASATIAVWNALTLPGGKAIAADQVAVLSRRGATFAIPAGSTAIVLRGAVTAYGSASTVGAEFRRMLEMAAPYQDTADRVAGSSVSSEWVDAYRVSQTGGTATTVAMPVAGGTISGTSVTVPHDGVVLVARTNTPAATGLAAAATRHTVPVALDDAGWNAATSIMDGKFQMISNGTAHTTYPGWPDSWPWYCQGVGRGCVRAVAATTATKGWLVVVNASGYGLTMPDYARVLAQLGATNAMGFDGNSHADFWRTGAAPITSFGSEPDAPAATLLSYH